MRALPKPATLWLAPLFSLVGGVLMVTIERPVIAPTAEISADTPYLVTGRAGDPAGVGHGRGMGQNDAFTQAKAGWNTERILGAAYPGMTMSFTDPSKVAVRLMPGDGHPLDVYADAGAVVAGRRVEPGQAVHLTAVPGGAAVTVSQGCTGPVVWQAPTTNPWVDPIDLGPNRPPAEMLKFCVNNAPYRGSLGVAWDSTLYPASNIAGPQRILNYVWLEDYVRGVVPMEMSATWADTGGAEALRSQAVAARSYVLADHRYPYASTCDTQDCQTYGGVSREDPRSDAAVEGTHGQVLLRTGQIARSEYSANAAPHWTKALTAGQISAVFGIGSLQSIEVTSRTDTNDVGAVQVVGSDRTVQVSGDEARAKLGLVSDDFDIVQGTDGPLQPPPIVPSAASAATGDVTAGPDQPLASDPIDAKYRELGGEAGKLGPAAGADMALPQHVGKFRMFKYGVIVWTPDLGAQSVDMPTVLAMFPETGIGPASGTMAVPPVPPTAQVVPGP